MNDFETLLPSERLRRECGCTTDEDAIAAYRAWLGIDLPDDFGGMGEAEFVRWRRVAEAIRDRLSGREMVASPTYEEGYETGRRDEAQARAAVRDEPRPIVPRDVRVGDLLAITYVTVVTGQDDEYNISTDDYQRHNLHAYNASARLVCRRPDPDAALHAAIEAAWDAADAFDAATFVAAIRSAGYVIEPAAKEADRA